MANKYWFKTGANASWSTLTGNWWNDSAHTQQATELPQTGDSVFLLGSTAPSSGPSSTLQLSVFDSSSLFTNYTANISQNIVIASGGTLRIGTVFSSTYYGHTWHGSAIADDISIEFRGRGNNFGSLGDHASFYHESVSSGIVGDHAEFHDSSWQSSGTIGDYAVFSDIAHSEAAVSDHATFQNDSYAAYSVGTYASFKNNSTNSALVGHYAVFDDNSTSIGALTDFAAFNDASTLACGAVNGTGGILSWNSEGYFYNPSYLPDILTIENQTIRVKKDIIIQLPGNGNNGGLFLTNAKIVMERRDGAIYLETDGGSGRLPVYLSESTIPQRLKNVYANPQGVFGR